MAIDIEIRLLGPIQIERASQAVHSIGSRKALALLAYLAARDPPAPRSQLADLLWPTLSEARGRANLSVTLHHLTTLLPDCLVAERHTVAFHRAPSVWLDTAAFVAHVEQGSVAALAAAADLFRDDYLADLALDDCPDFELWLVRRREEWRSQVTQVLGRLIDYHHARREFPEGLRFAARLLRIEPWHEEGHRRLMLLFAADGQRSAALAQFETCRRVLADELGVAPGEDTLAVYQQIRDGNRPDRPTAYPLELSTPPVNLPAQLTSFVGRETELAAVLQRLDNPACRLLTLVGPGGVGKSRLALAAAEARAGNYVDGALFVPLASITQPEQVVATIAGLLNSSYVPPADPRQVLLDHLRRQQLLLVLDNFEQLLAAAPLVIEILHHAPGVKVLVTSRERLHLQAEWLLPLHGLACPPADGPVATDEYPAVRLFLERAAQVEPDFTVTGATPDPLGQLCRLVDGMPLAIELAAARLGEVGPGQIVAEITANLDFLNAAHHDVPDRHHSMRAVFESSWRLLSMDQQWALAGLSTFRGGFTLAAAEHVAGASADIVVMLREKFLVRPQAAGRFDLHELVRQFAVEKQQALALADRPQRRHLAYFLDLAESAEPELDRLQEPEWLDRLEVEHDNLRAALEWSLAHQPVSAVLLAGALWRFWMVRGHFGEGQRWLEASLRAAHAAPVAARAKASTGAGSMAWSQGDYQRAAMWHGQALALYEEIGEEPGIAFARSCLGNQLQYLGDTERARALIDSSLALYEVLGDQSGMSLTLGNLGFGEAMEGHFDAAARYFEAGLVHARAASDRPQIALALHNLADVARYQGELDRSVPLVAECLALCRELGDKRLAAMTLYVAGRIDYQRGDLEQSTAHFGESLAQSRDIGDRLTLAQCLEGLAAVCALRQQAEVAARLIGAADAVREQMGAPVAAADQADYDRTIDLVGATLGSERLAVARGAGRRLALDDIVANARASAGTAGSAMLGGGSGSMPRPPPRSATEPSGDR